jgi:peroxiredoxin
MKKIVIALSAFFIIIIFTACSKEGQTSGKSTGEIPITMDKPYRETIKFALAAAHFFVYDPMDVKYKDFELEDLNGKMVHLSDFQGKAILLYFWATWATVSQDELPAMEKLYDALKNEGMTIVSVNLQESKEVVNEFVNKNKIHFPVLLDQKGTLEQVYSRLRVPTAYIIDSEGYLAAATAGQTEWNTPKMREIFRILVKKLEWKPQS